MPAILSDADHVLDWLDFVRVSAADALNLLANQAEHLVIDPVSNYVFKKSSTGPEASISAIRRPPSLDHFSIVHGDCLRTQFVW